MANKEKSIRNRILIVAATLLVSFSAESADLFEGDAYKNYQPDLKNGETLYNAGSCGSCHGAADNPDLLGGGLKLDSFVGKFYAPNISNSPKGVANWSNADFLNAMLNGVSPKGRHYYPVFPYTNYAGMKPEDVLDIKAYIGGLSKSDNTVPENEISFPYNLNSTMLFWKRRNFETTRWAPTNDSQLARGKYLVENVGACGSCHTPRTTTYGTDREKWMEGGKGLTTAYAPSINATVMNGLSSSDIFTKGVLVEGKKLNGQPLVDPVMRKIAKQTAKLSDEDRLAMYAYLKGSEIKVVKAKLNVQTCGGETTAAAAPATGQNSQLTADADEFIGKYCRNCHGLGQSSQGSFPAGTLASIAADAAFITPGDPDSSRLYKSVVSGRMPLGDQPTTAEIARLGEWISSLSTNQSASPVLADNNPPRMRQIIDRQSFVRAALADIDAVDELDREFVRYISYRSQYNGRFPCEEDSQYAKRQSLYVAGLNKMLNSVSLGTTLVVPETVSNTKDLLVRVDIRDLGWETYQWDLLVAAYPYGVDPYSDPTLTALTKETRTVLPILRSDWFMANSSRPAIYHALLKLPENIRDLEGRLGVDVHGNIDRGNVARAAFDKGVSGVSAHNRMIERHDLPQGGYYWKSYDFAGSFGVQSLRDFPHGPNENAPLAQHLKPFEHDGGEMIFSLPNGMQGYYLSDNKGNRIDEGPEKIVSYQQRPKDKAPTIVNGRSCIDCHAEGILTKRDNMRQHLETTNKFDVDQTKFLLKMYIEQSEMDKFYDQDRGRFMRSLDRIGATEKAVDGHQKSRIAPGNKEIVTWYADLYESNLNLEEFASEFNLKADEFKTAVLRISDPSVQRLAMQKILQLEGGSTIPRFEVEQQFPYLQKALTGLDPLTTVHITEYGNRYGKSGSHADHSQKIKVVHAEKAYEVGPVAKPIELSESYSKSVPQYQKKEYVDGGKLEIALKVDSTNVHIGDKLAFTLQSNKDCEVQILYVESTGKVEAFPASFVGDPWLRANKPKRIPQEEAGYIEFDEAGHSETLIIFCKQDGLGNDKLTTKSAKAMAQSSRKIATRGITFKLAKKVEKQQGKSALHTVTFNVSP